MKTKAQVIYLNGYFSWECFRGWTDEQIHFFQIGQYSINCLLSDSPQSYEWPDEKEDILELKEYVEDPDQFDQMITEITNDIT